MRKAIKLKAILWIEGEDEPAHDFAGSTIKALREVIDGGKHLHPELALTIKDIAEAGDDDEDESDDQAVQKT